MPDLKMAEPVITHADRDAVARAVGSGWVSGFGPEVEAFEREFSAFVGAAHGIATASGTTALHLALAAVGAGPGDEVILPAFCHAAAWQAVVQTGATPVLVDSEADTWNLSADAVASAISPRTRAIIAVHIYGLPCDMDGLAAIALKSGVSLVEDAAEAHGATYRGRGAGAFGAAGCFSFYANKIITTGEGGMLTTSDAALAERARRLRDLSGTPEHRYRYETLGYSYRMPAASAALGRSQLGRIDRLAARRIRNGDLYREGLDGTPGLSFQPRLDDRVGSDWMVGMLVRPDAALDRGGLMRHLASEGIETRPFFLPIHRQPFWKGRAQSFPTAECLGDLGLVLPSGSNLTDSDVSRVIDSILGCM
jgi:perosamine synthetase